MCIRDRERLQLLRRALVRAERYQHVQGGVARHLLRYSGARTGRFSARSTISGVGLHQLSKGRPDLPELALERRVIVPPPGSLFRAGDLVAIEARIVAWLADEQEQLALSLIHI